METVIERVEIQTDLRKPYKKPEIIQELELETSAGSPTPPPFLGGDPLNNDLP
jgi:hypothetical protein